MKIITNEAIYVQKNDIEKCTEKCYESGAKTSEKCDKKCYKSYFSAISLH